MMELDPSIDVEQSMTETTLKFAAGPVTGEMTWPRIVDGKIADKLRLFAEIYEEQNSDVVEQINELAEEIDT